jgi:hypothetical protein
LKEAACFALVSCLPYLTLKMEETYFSKTSFDFQRITRRYIPDDGTFPDHGCENLKSNKNFGHMTTNSQVEDANPWAKFRFVSDYKLTFFNKNNNKLLVGFEVCALRKQAISVLPGTPSLLLRNLPLPFRNCTFSLARWPNVYQHSRHFSGLRSTGVAYI